MGQSLVNQYTHIIFSTKNRQELIFPSIEFELYSYLGGICNNLECNTIQIGGHLDHVHILCMFSKKLALDKLLQELKANSSKWMKKKDDRLKQFFWQDGYGAFSVSPNHVSNLKEYISNQHEHHKDVTFKEEYLKVLKKNNIKYDERYLWI